MSAKPKTPKPSANELELQRSQRKEIDLLTRDRNTQLKALKRNLGARRGLLGSGSERGIGSGGNGGRAAASGGAGILGSGGSSASGTARRVPGFSSPSRESSR